MQFPFDIKVTAYYEEAKNLSINDEAERILKYADIATSAREVGKIGSVIGTVCTVASSIFGSDPQLSISITAFSSMVWFSAHQVAELLEPKAKNILQQPNLYASIR